MSEKTDVLLASPTVLLFQKVCSLPWEAGSHGSCFNTATVVTTHMTLSKALLLCLSFLIMVAFRKGTAGELF